MPTARLALTVISALLAFTLPSCSTKSSSAGRDATSTLPADLTVGESQSGATVTIAEGGSLTLELPVTSGTGYVWEVRAEPSGLLRVPAEGETIRGNAAMPGSVTQVRWVLRDAVRGQGTVEAVYRRPWETDVPPAKRFSVAVKVEPEQVPSRNP